MRFFRTIIKYFGGQHFFIAVTNTCTVDDKRNEIFRPYNSESEL